MIRLMNSLIIIITDHCHNISSTGLYFVAMNYTVHSIMYGYFCLQALKMVMIRCDNNDDDNNDDDNDYDDDDDEMYDDVDVFKFTISRVIMHVMIPYTNDHDVAISYMYRCPSLFPQSSSR